MNKLETLEKLHTMINYFQTRMYERMCNEFYFGLPKTQRLIEIYAKCIIRLSERIIKVNAL